MDKREGYRYHLTPKGYLRPGQLQQGTRGENRAHGEAGGGPARQSSESRGEGKIGGNHQTEGHQISSCFPARKATDSYNKGVGSADIRDGRTYS
jgi:hypothetical protein